MKSYEELVGAEGRRVFYRAQRYKAQELFRENMPDVEVGDVALTLFDFSLSGIAALADRTVECWDEAGAEVPVHIRLGEATLHKGRGRICRVEASPFGTKIAVSLTTGHLDVSRIMATHEKLSLERELDGGREAAAERIDPEYRRVCADVLHLLRRYSSALARLDDKDNRQALADDAGREEALRLCEERILPEWQGLWYRANELVDPVMKDPEAFKATKRFTELVLTPEFMAGPIWRRCYEKPLGYPGDFEVMNYVYAWRHQGETVFARLLHRIGLHAMECVTSRMVTMQQTIAEVVAANPGGAPARVTNVGCGPAQEVANYLQLKSLPRPVEFTLIDQDHDALSHAYQHIYPEVVRLGGHAKVRCLQVSFNELFRAGQLFREIPPQDLIYGVGLFDYLMLRRARALVATLFERLAPGGSLVVGNVKAAPTSGLWPTEFICDWSLIHRSKAEMCELADGLDPTMMEIKTDRTGLVYLLCLHKPRDWEEVLRRREPRAAPATPPLEQLPARPGNGP